MITLIAIYLAGAVITMILLGVSIFLDKRWTPSYKRCAISITFWFVFWPVIFYLALCDAAAVKRLRT